MSTHLQNDDHILVGGDFNFVFDSKFDRNWLQVLQFSQNKKTISNLLTELMLNVNIVDTWRTQNPDTKCYTCHR